MKTWNITIKAENETEALKLVNFLHETFKMASKIDQPVDHVYADMNGGHGENLVCEQVKK